MVYRIQGLLGAMLFVATIFFAAAIPTDASAVGQGEFCRSNTDCNAGLQCADGRRCAPVDRTGKAGDYCHHNNHCVTGRCSCDPGGSGFCRDWERWPEGIVGGGASLRIGFCSGKQANGGVCRDNAECTSNHCADGQRCAPRDGTGGLGAYCHHNNHCQGDRQCICPEGPGGFGFCDNWENYSFVRAQNMNKARTAFFCR